MGSSVMRHVRPPAVAGAFYTGERELLADEVERFLAAASLSVEDWFLPTKAVIVPHAGYIYSGATAALAYARLARFRNLIRRVVLLGPVHRVAVRGLALPGAAAFATPLGEVEVDTAAVEVLLPLRQVSVTPQAHAMEHSLEVQLPFLQSVLADFSIVPLAVGDASPEEVAQVLELLWGGEETVIVISSDLSHFLPYATARKIDRETVESILNLNGAVTHHQACGGTPINGMLLAAKRRGLKPHLLGLCNSGDTAGDRQRVVGYASFAFTEGEHDRA